jgi:hypothetical protein
MGLISKCSMTESSIAICSGTGDAASAYLREDDPDMPRKRAAFVWFRPSALMAERY